MATHLLHAQDREHLRAATNDGALMGMSGLSKMGRWGRENPVVANEVGGGRERKGGTTRVVGKVRGETVSTGAKEAADINMVTHLLHAPDREHMREATNDGALMGMSGLSKTGTAGPRKPGRCERSGGWSGKVGEHSARRWKGTWGDGQHRCEGSSR
jgi:hypothetical protein